MDNSGYPRCRWSCRTDDTDSAGRFFDFRLRVIGVVRGVVQVVVLAESGERCGCT
jgi:hypothetical protein